MRKTVVLSLVMMGMVVSCSEGSFTGEAVSGSLGPKKKTPNIDTTSSGNPDDTLVVDEGSLITRKCTELLRVPGRSNLYFAGSQQSASLTYFVNYSRIDRASTESPVELVSTDPTCLQPGRKIFFNITGNISHDQGRSQTNADGKIGDVRPHLLGAQLGKSNVTAPLNAMMAVFLGPDQPVGSPATLDFSAASSRDYQTLSPTLGQIFFVGDGKTSIGKTQYITVPQGATRLFLGIMDAFEWNNNTGELQGGFSSVTN